MGYISSLKRLVKFSNFIWFDVGFIDRTTIFILVFFCNLSREIDLFYFSDVKVILDP